MAVTIAKLKITPYTQKDGIAKIVYGDEWGITVRMPTPHVAGDTYAIGIDYENLLYPPARPLCAGTDEFTVSGDDLSFTLKLGTARLRNWCSALKKPTPIYVQIVRTRGDTLETLMLDTLLALPSVFDGEVTVYPGDPLEDLLDKKLDKPEEDGRPGQYLALGADGETVWKTGGGGGGGDVQADWDESDSDSPAYILNKPTIPPPQVQADWDESDSEDVAYIRNKPTIPASPIVASTAPTASTEGAVGQLYVDTATSKTYHCTAVTVDDVTTYTWNENLLASETFPNGTSVSWKSEAHKNIFSVSFGSTTGIKFGDGTVGSSTTITLIGQSITLTGTNYVRIGWLKFTPILHGEAIQNTANGFCILRPDGTARTPSGFSVNVTEIPSATSAYALSEGAFTHAPSSAPTYSLPSVGYDIVADGNPYMRIPAWDGNGYYCWVYDQTRRYTASATPSVGDNTYINTALTNGAKAITALNQFTHEIILTVRFSASALSVAFQDAAGNAIAPLPLAGTIADGSVVAYRCTWEELLGRWVIMPVMLGTYSAGV